MDRSVTVRYFKIEEIGRTPPFDQAVDAAFNLGASPYQRQRVLGPGIQIRLENRERRRGLLFGEVVRVQTENIPPEAQQAGLVPLAIGGLGHSVAFGYDQQSSIMAIQFDPRGVSIGRLLDYLSNVVGAGKYSYSPIINEDAWERYNRGAPRTLTLSVAAPRQLRNLEGNAGGVLSASRRLAEITNAPIVTIEVSMGHARGSLLKGAVDQVVRAFTSEGAEGGVRGLSVKTKEEGQPTEEIDFLKDLARDQDILDLPVDNPVDHLRMRYAFIERSFRARLDGLRELYAD